MRAVILAAGVGRRLGAVAGERPKALLRFGGRSLLERHVVMLRGCGVERVVVGTGYRARAVGAELARLGLADRVHTVHNTAYREGSVVTLWALEEHLRGGEDVVLMDADVLYDRRMLERLLGSPHPNCFLLDRDIEPGEEPVKLCVRGGRPVELRKRIPPETVYDYCGESVGFFRLSGEMAARLAAAAAAYVEVGRREAPHEEALRDVLREDGGASFGVENVTGLPWVEIDFPADVRRAEREVLPRLTPLEL